MRHKHTKSDCSVVSTVGITFFLLLLLLSNHPQHSLQVNAFVLLKEPVLLLVTNDITAGIIAAATVAPWVASVDRAITLNASGQTTSIQSSFIQDIKETILKSRPFIIGIYSQKVTVQWLWFVYSVTFMTANITDTLANEIWHISSTIPVLWASTTANTIACIAKDAAFAQMYGSSSSRSGKIDNEDGMRKKKSSINIIKNSRNKYNDNKQHSPSPVPILSYVVWLLRDIVTAFSAFTLPPLLQNQLQVPTILSRFAGPVVAQYFTTPLHLTGLALYNDNLLLLLDQVNNNNNKNDNNISNDTIDQIQRILITVQEKLPETIVARQARIIPAFSIGGIVNSQLRELLALHNNM